MIIKDEQGEVEISGEMFMAMLADCHKMGIATGAQYGAKWPISDRQLLERSNKAIDDTWGNAEWREKFVKYIFIEARRQVKK